MPTIRIQHAVPSWDDWKQAFDRDPMDRKGSGVRRYSIHRSVDDPNVLMIDLEFATLEQAEKYRVRLIELWSGPARALLRGPEAWVVEAVESAEL